MREHVNPCLLVERIRYVCIGVVVSGNEARAGHISLAHLSLLGPEITSRLAKTKSSESESMFLLRTSADLGSRLDGQPSQTSVPLPSTHPPPFSRVYTVVVRNPAGIIVGRERRFKCGRDMQEAVMVVSGQKGEISLSHDPEKR